MKDNQQHTHFMESSRPHKMYTDEELDEDDTQTGDNQAQDKLIIPEDNQEEENLFNYLDVDNPFDDQQDDIEPEDDDLQNNVTQAVIIEDEEDVNQVPDNGVNASLRHINYLGSKETLEQLDANYQNKFEDMAIRMRKESLQKKV